MAISAVRTVAVFLATCSVVAAASLVSLVDTRIGTGGHGFGVGSLNPGAQVPFGAMRLGPDTSYGPIELRWQHFGGYYYNDVSIDAFSHTHLVGAGVGDWGNVGVMVTRETVTSDLVKNRNYRSKFSHDGEIAQPGYYAVTLQTPNATAEMTVSGTLSGIHQYTFHDTTPNFDAHVLVDVCHTISPNACKNATVDVSVAGGVGTVSGSVLVAGSLTERGPLGGVWVYFYALVDNVSSAGLWENDQLLADTVRAAQTTSKSLGAYLAVNTTTAGPSGVVSTVRIGISFISVDNAKNNLVVQQQVAGEFASFAATKAAAQAEWESILSRVQIGSDASTSATDVAKFYGGLYRATLAPTKYTEANNEYLGFDGKVHKWGSIGDYHSDMSLWDIHRSQAPLLTLVAPKESRDVVRSLVTMFQEGGKLPRWPLANVYTGCMVGSHGIEVVVDAILKGVQGINADDAYEACASANAAQDAGDSYDALGYVPEEAFQQAPSLTLDYAFDDWATSQLAGFVGNTSAQQTLLARSKNYRNVWSSTDMLFCPKGEAGNITCPAIPEMPYPLSKYYTEGSGWEYQWFVPGDLEGLVALYPNTETYVNRLNFFFAESLKWPFGTTLPNPYYWAGNEPDLLAPWQFNAAGNAYANYTQYWTRKMLDIKYNLNADGIPGNDDFGTMSAWECWAYMGLYPITGSTRFSIGAPAFPSVNVTLPPSALAAFTHGDRFVAAGNSVVTSIIAHGASPTAVYVSKAMANGVPLPTPFVTWEQLVNGGKGGELEFWMSETPSTWGS